MKKLIITSAFALLAFVGINTAHAQVADETPAPVAGLGGYSTPCFYLRQTFEEKTGYICKDSDHSQVRFALDQQYRESILAPWRQYIFVTLAAKYSHQ